MSRSTTRKSDLGKVTAQDVADEAGVSISAVSRTYTPGASVSRKMEQKVLEAAKKLGYRPNILARSLMTQKTNLIGILIKDFQNPAYLRIIDALTAAIQERGLQPLLINMAHAGGIRESIDMIMQYQADGLIETSGSAIDPKLSIECRKAKLPLIQFGFHSKSAKTTAVCCDNNLGGRMAANILLDNGYKYLAYIGGDVDGAASTERRDGFVAALAAKGRRRWLIEAAGDWTYQAGFEAASRLLSRKRPPDAIFCADDIIAMGAMDAARSVFDLRVPEDLGIVGFDDIILADSFAYSLTTIHQPYDQMIESALDLLSEQIQAQASKPRVKLFTGKLVLRNSHQRIQK